MYYKAHHHQSTGLATQYMQACIAMQIHCMLAAEVALNILVDIGAVYNSSTILTVMQYKYIYRYRYRYRSIVSRINYTCTLVALRRHVVYAATEINQALFQDV